MNHAVTTLRVLIVALILPLALATIATTIGFVIAGELPVSVPVHWDFAGRVNGYDSPYSIPITIASICLPITAIFGAVAVLFSHRGPLTPVIKLMSVSGAWITVLVSIPLIGSLLDPRFGAAPGTALGAAFGGAIVVAVGLWFALPPGVAGVGGRARPTPQPLALADGERAAWFRTTTASKGVIWSLVGVCVVTAVAMSIAIVMTAGQAWALAFVPVVVSLATLSTFAWTVRVDAGGVLVRSIIGFPRFRIPLRDILSAEVIDVGAISQYGGWGIRIIQSAGWSHHAIGRGPRSTSAQRPDPRCHGG
jgi:hypothetical protein